jgi:hypothetical protein
MANIYTRTLVETTVAMSWITKLARVLANHSSRIEKAKAEKKTWYRYVFVESPGRTSPQRKESIWASSPRRPEQLSLPSISPACASFPDNCFA